VDKTEAAWLAGILEGEACFDFADAEKKFPRIRIEMKDEDVIQRVKDVSQGRASVRKLSRADSNTKHADTYCFAIYDKLTVKSILQAIKPWLGDRRLAAVEEMLTAL